MKKKYQNNKLNLQGSIQNSIAAAYRKENPKITHFYNNVNYSEVPIWAIFEILTMGDFGHLLSSLTINMREKISRAIGLNLSCDTYRELLYKYVYALKDLRNAIAHNDVVYDTRFREMDPSRPMRQCLILEVGLPYINFKTIGDYIILIYVWPVIQRRIAERLLWPRHYPRCLGFSYKRHNLCPRGTHII